MHSILGNKHIAFIGAGNMGGAIAEGLLRKRLCRPEQILLADIQPERLHHFATTHGVRVTADNAEAARQADILILSVKPQGFPDVLPGLRDHLRLGTLVLSIAAGISTASIEKQLGGAPRVLRAMPNMPALTGDGASALCKGQFADESDLAAGLAILEAVGVAIVVPEKQMHAVTAVSGSGPAYVFYLIEAMEAAAYRLGLPPETARQLTLATVEGSAALCRETGIPPSHLRDRVTSKGGTTAAALKVLNQHDVHHHLIEAIEAACRRAGELEKGK